MKLHELVNLRNLLNESIVLDEVNASIETLLHRISSLLQTENIDASLMQSIKDVREYYTSISKMLDTPPKELRDTLIQVNKKIDDLTVGFNKRGYMINGFYASNATDVDGERNLRFIPVSDTLVQFVRARISLYADWRYPGLEIGPGDGFWTPMLVAADPLYIIDNHDEFLRSTMTVFNEDYQRRLCPYVIDYRYNDLSALPLNQIGFAFAWNVFNFFPYEELKSYLAQVWSVLRPGGVVLFSYNNTEHTLQAQRAEEGWMSWMPRTQLNALLSELGYEVISFHEPELNVSAVEVRKPGTMATIKAHQVLGEIKSITI